MAYSSPSNLAYRPVPHPQRVTPLFLVDDMRTARRRYTALGFDVVETGDPHYVGMRAGDTGIILATPEHAERTMPSEIFETLKKGPVLYIWVESIDVIRNHLVDPIIDERVTDYGTWELFAESRVGPVIFAERLNAPTTRH